MTATPEPATADLQYAVTILATALDNLGARIYRDIHIDSSYIPLPADDPALLRIVSDFSSFADDVLGALNHPAVKRALAGAK